MLCIKMPAEFGFFTRKDMAALVSALSPHIGKFVWYAIYKADAPHLAPLSVMRIVIHYKESATDSLSAEITERGDVYNPTFHGAQLGILFDWTKRLGYTEERIRERTNLFRDELITTVMTYDYINDSFVPVQ